MKSPLHLTRRLARRIAAACQGSTDPRVRAWLELAATIPREGQTPQKFPHVSVVETFRKANMVGYEVWRHFDNKQGGPRKKARLFFGSSRYGHHLNARRAAYKAAAMMSKMTLSELHEWWAEYRAARSTSRPVTSLWRSEARFADAVSSEDGELMSAKFCGYRRAS